MTPAGTDAVRLARMTAEGLSDPAIADAFGVNARTVLRWRQRLGLRSHWTPDRHPCPSAAAYNRGCRCTDCRAANAAAHREFVRRTGYKRPAKRGAVPP